MPLLVANWKMNGTAVQAAEYVTAISGALEAAPAGVEVVYCPPFPYLAVARATRPQHSRLALGGQNCHASKEGSFTGEVSAAMLRDMGCTHVILGHSERRDLGETDADILNKAKTAISVGLTPVVCVGEGQEDYEKSHTIKVLDGQIVGLKRLPAGAYVIAYEPVWAIGAGKTPKATEIAAAHMHIKSTLGSGLTVLYGGSVKLANLKEILKTDGVDGALIGGASLAASDMKALIVMAGGIK